MLAFTLMGAALFSLGSYRSQHPGAARIAPENLPQAMEPFFTSKPEGKGTGLGLLICSRVVQGHGGRLELRSELGKGTTARVLLLLSNGANGKSIRSTALEDGGGDGQK